MATKKKTTTKKTTTPDEAFGGDTKADRQPMDASAPTAPAGTVPIANRQRNAYALDTLIAEVLEVFPETTHEVSGYNALNTALHVAFHPEEFERLDEVLSLIEDDVRVEEVLAEREDHTILVALHPNLRLQDLREPFNIKAAWTELADKYGDAR